MILEFFDVIMSNNSFIWGANKQERDVTAGPEKRDKVCGAGNWVPRYPYAHPGD
jgi:hypothetical protein